MTDGPKMGHLLDGSEERDAVHFALAPVVAGMDLFAGEHVGFVGPNDMIVSTKAEEKIGIVDPFINGPIAKGDRCWLMLYPNTITALRHEWAHPAFAGRVAGKKEAEEWLRVFALSWGMDYDDMLDDVRRGNGITAIGRDIHSWSEIDTDDQIKFWRSVEIVTGRTYDDAHRAEVYFSCSC